MGKKSEAKRAKKLKKQATADIIMQSIQQIIQAQQQMETANVVAESILQDTILTAIGEEVKETTEEVKEAVEEVTEEVKEAVEEAVEEVKETVEEITEEVKDKISIFKRIWLKFTQCCKAN